MMNGLGSYSLMIDKESEYKMIFLQSDTLIEKQFPKARSTGAVIQVTTDQDSVLSTIYTKSSAVNSGYLVIHNRGIVKRVVQVYFSNEQATIKTAYNNLGDGINVFSYFDLDKNPIAERLYFKYPEETESKIALETNYFKKRQKINLTLQATSSNMYNASMAVYKIDSLQNIDELNIENYIWLSSDLSSKVEHPDIYFN